MKSKIIGALVAGVLVIGAVGVFFSVERIKPGFVGVVYSPTSGVEQSTLSQGWKIVMPWKKVTQYSIATEQLYLSADEREGSKENDSFNAMCKDGQMNVDFEMSYSFDAERVPELYTKYRGMKGEDIVNTIVRGKVKTFANEVTSQFSVIEAHMEKKAEVNKMLTEHLAKQLKQYGIQVESANFTRTSVNKAVDAAITERSKASQQLQAEKQKKEKAVIEAERIKIEAQGKADAALIKAKSEAEANKVLSESLTGDLIEMEKYKKWNGQSPQVVGGSAIIDARTKGE